jgi:hypothetical protein
MSNITELDVKTLDACNELATQLVAEYRAGKSIVFKINVLATLSGGLQLVIAAKVMRIDREAGAEACAVIAKAS